MKNQDIYFCLITGTLFYFLVLFVCKFRRRKIYCDTNIWYDIGEGTISKNTLKGLRLVATFNNLIELTHTIKLGEKADIQKVHRAVNALLNCAEEINLSPPIELIVRINSPSFKIDKKFGVKMLNSLKRFALMTPEEIGPDVILEMKKIAKEIRYPAEELLDWVNDVKLPEIRKNIESGIGFHEHEKLDGKPGVTNLIKTITELYVKQYYESIKGFECLYIPEPFLSSFTRYFKYLEITDGKRMKLNDWIDGFNLLYIDKRCLYWTNEGKGKLKNWRKYIIDGGMEHILFKQKDN